MEARKSTTEFDHGRVLSEYLTRLTFSQFKEIVNTMLYEVKLRTNLSDSVSPHDQRLAQSVISTVCDEFPASVKKELERAVHATVAEAKGDESRLTRDNIETMAMTEYFSVLGQELLVSSIGGVAGPKYQSFNVEAQPPVRVRVIDTDHSSIAYWVGDFCRPLFEAQLLGTCNGLPDDVRQVWVLGTARSLSGEVLPAHIVCKVGSSLVSGTQGVHDWCVGRPSEDGYPIYVDDRQICYRRTFKEARAFALEIIDRIQADGDYRLGDKPLGHMPPAHVNSEAIQG